MSSFEVGDLIIPIDEETVNKKWFVHKEEIGLSNGPITLNAVVVVEIHPGYYCSPVTHEPLSDMLVVYSMSESKIIKGALATNYEKLSTIKSN
jgi:hypothetical protein